MTDGRGGVRVAWLALRALALGACASSGSAPLDAVTVPPADTAGGVDVNAVDTSDVADVNIIDTSPDDDVEADGGALPDASDASDTTVADTAPACPLGHACNPIPVDALPFSAPGDTTGWTSLARASYGCAPATDEGGPDVWYALTLTEVGVLTVSVDDVAGDAVDIDVHLLDGAGDRCLARDNRSFSTLVRAGAYRVVADTWVSADGLAHPGPYALTVTFQPLGSGPCALALRDERMYWTACAAGVDCFEADYRGAPARFLRTPALGPVVHEAHLVTPDEAFPGNGWPSAARDQIERHYALSQAATGYVMARQTEWAPAGEGGSQWGQGAAGIKPPPEAEAWYVNMYWKDRPAPGTRLLVYNPKSGRAVVAAGGYETGPGANTAIGGAVEELHHALGSVHRDALVMGFLVDQALPFGPISCAPAP